jgi:hypothetical protein
MARGQVSYFATRLSSPFIRRRQRNADSHLMQKSNDSLQHLIRWRVNLRQTSDQRGYRRIRLEAARLIARNTPETPALVPHFLHVPTVKAALLHPWHLKVVRLFVACAEDPCLPLSARRTGLRVLERRACGLIDIWRRVVSGIGLLVV